MQKQLQKSGHYLLALLRWLAVGIFIGAICGLVGGLFSMAVEWATHTRQHHSWLVYLLPLGCAKKLCNAELMLGHLVNAGMELLESVEKASDYITKTIRRTVELDIPTTDGICIEEYLSDLA